MSAWREFISKNTDKLLVMLVLSAFYAGSWYGFKVDNPNFANSSLDLVKQLVAAFLTLTVSGRLSTNTRASDNGGTNGTQAKGTTASGTPGTSSGV